MACTWLVEDDPPEMRKGTGATVPFAYSLASQLGLDSAELAEAQRFSHALTLAVERFRKQQRRENAAMQHLARAFCSKVKPHA